MGLIGKLQLIVYEFEIHKHLERVIRGFQSWTWPLNSLNSTILEVFSINITSALNII